MKKLSALFFILVITSYLETIQVFAQEKSRFSDGIVIEISVPTFDEIDKRQVPINLNNRTRYETAGGRGQMCSHCVDTRIGSYEFKARAWRMGKNKSKISFQIILDKSCITKKVSMVFRNKQTKLQLKCGVNLVAYYGHETKKAN